ncbi:hypothetical protein [Legionella nagasakiensis]|uniref:hypothetical protein n=1 Tax=Legionella nagasakiensis TaxID=535290 RepID=UPI0010542B5C|nr:hypothetical protein [Legionella nagasakiensis]
MNKLYSKLSILILTMGVSTYGWTDEPCKPIAQACAQEGYYIGGNKVGKGLVEDCIKPVISGEKTLAGTNFSDTQIQQCKMLLEKKMAREKVENTQM